MVASRRQYIGNVQRNLPVKCGERSGGIVPRLLLVGRVDPVEQETVLATILATGTVANGHADPAYVIQAIAKQRLRRSTRWRRSTACWSG
jgi:hypothetical protein